MVKQLERKRSLQTAYWSLVAAASAVVAVASVAVASVAVAAKSRVG